MAAWCPCGVCVLSAGKPERKKDKCEEKKKRREGGGRPGLYRGEEGRRSVRSERARDVGEARGDVRGVAGVTAEGRRELGWKGVCLGVVYLRGVEGYE